MTEIFIPVVSVSAYSAELFISAGTGEGKEIMKFVLFDKLKELDASETVWLVAGIAIAAALAVFLLIRSKKGGKNDPYSIDVKSLVRGALCISLSLILSYIKLFSMPLGGSVTLCSMLPVTLFAWKNGPEKGFSISFAYCILQILQGAWVVHPIQFMLDYFAAFTVLGISSFFPKKLTLGVVVACIMRFMCSMTAGAVFYAASAYEAGFTSAWLYSFLYNGATIGIEAVLCAAVTLVPPIRRMAEKL